ncbi:MAG TPA: hypothetical protein PKC67_08625 [Kiritimatiellia bacterium]|nr:hypothetical protein [Kiritimatiellia bacterium]HMP34402.1 hypothetical protein [Kiritimatiellia bacterium]
MRHDDHFFNFGPYAAEVDKKMRSLQVPARRQAGLLWDVVAEAGSTADLHAAQELFCWLEAQGLDRVYPNYLSHPVRVAASMFATGLPVDTGWLLFALCHNGDEAGILDRLPEMEGREMVVARIRTVTIDRAREKDPVYRRDFYDGIAASPGLMLFKCLDKLDNLLWWPALDIEDYHYRIIQDDVLPRMPNVHARLGVYVAGLLDYVRERAVSNKGSHHDK